MDLCAACQALADAGGDVPPHQGLGEVGRETVKPFMRSKIITTTLVCQTCGAKWKHTDDRDERFKSWRRAE